MCLMQIFGYLVIWLFGFPCTDVSHIGKGKRIKEGTDSGLLFENTRLLSEANKNQRLYLQRMLKN